jgi:hypothetical protein
LGWHPGSRPPACRKADGALIRRLGANCSGRDTITFATRTAAKSFFIIHGPRQDPQGPTHLHAHRNLRRTDATRHAFCVGICHRAWFRAQSGPTISRRRLNRGIVTSDPIGALAHLQLGRAWHAAGNQDKAKAAYRDFLALWKDAVFEPRAAVFVLGVLFRMDAVHWARNHTGRILSPDSRRVVKHLHIAEIFSVA